MGNGAKEREEKSQADNEISSEDDPLSDFERDCMWFSNQEESAQRVTILA